MQLDVWFDPACPWTWNTARWLLDVAASRPDVDLHWRTFSLDIKNADIELPPKIRAGVQASRRALRVIERVSETAGDQAVEALYVELGRRIHHDEEAEPDLGDVLTAAGLDPSLADSAGDESLDERIEASMRQGLDLAGDDVGVPIVAFPGPDGLQGFFGPILSPVPTGAESLEIFDALATLATRPQFTELKRARHGAPQLPARP